MFNVRTAVVLGFVVAFSTVARAATPIEFVFEGVFTQTTNTVHQVGDPFTSRVLFDPNAMDTDPSPLFGNYAYIRWVAPGPTSTPIVFQDIPSTVGSIQVFLSGGANTWRVDFQGIFQFGWTLSIDFPLGTFPNDGLPRTLDLSQSTGSRFEGFDGTNFVDLRGTITSLTIVPEPVSLAALVFPVLLARRALGTHT